MAEIKEWQVNDKDRRCAECGVSNRDVPFKKNRNLCMEHWREYKNSYDKRTDQSSKIQEWKENNREEYRATCRRRYKQDEGKGQTTRQLKTWRSFFSKQIGSIRSRSTKPGPHDPKSGPRTECDIDLEYIIKLGDSMGWKCQISGLPMIRKLYSPFAASIDRIDDSKGHIKGNIQIVCQLINIGKRHHGNEYASTFLDAYHQLRSKPLLTGKHECDCGRIVTDDEWDEEGMWCNDCLESYWQDKEEEDK